MSDDSMPDSPFSEMGVAAIQLHTNFTELCAAGFTREEAMAIFLLILGNQISGS